MPIESGRYFIINVQTKNRGYLGNANSEEPVQGRYQQYETGEQWDVIKHDNGHHTIMNIGHEQYAASGYRSPVGAPVKGWEKPQTWLIQKTTATGQYTISTTDTKIFWGLADGEQGTPIVLGDAPTSPFNWWMFKEVETGNDAKVDQNLDNDTAAGDMILRAVYLLELAPPPASLPELFELDLVVIQEMPYNFIRNVTETANKICRPLFKSQQLKPSNLLIQVIEFESFQTAYRFRLFGPGSFDNLRRYRGVDLPWTECSDPAIPSFLTKGMNGFRSSATKVVVLNLRYIPLQNGGHEQLQKLIDRMIDENVILILTLSEPHRSDTLFATDLFQELARLSSGTVLSFPADGGGFYPCIVDYLQNFDAESIATNFSNIKTINPEIYSRQQISTPPSVPKNDTRDVNNGTDGYGNIDPNQYSENNNGPKAVTDLTPAADVPKLPAIEPDLAGATWIWTPEMPYDQPPPAPRGFRRVMDIPNNVVDSLIIDISCDNFQTVYVNGACLGYGLDFRSAKRWSITFPPTNKVVIAVYAANDPISKGVAGLVAAAVTWDSTNFQRVVYKTKTDASWKCTTTTPPKGFEQTNFNDRTWIGVRIMGPFGILPWTVIKPTKTEAITEGFKTVEVNGIPDAPRAPLADPIIASLVPETPTPDLAGATWIWTPELPYDNPPQAPRGFRRVINLPAGKFINSLVIDISCDNFQTVYVNGFCLGYGLDFRLAKRWSVTFPRTNKVVIAVYAANDPISKNVAGLLAAAMAWDSVNFQGEVYKAQTDASWKCLTITPPKGFEQTNYNDRTWSGVRVIGSFGIPPWTVIKPTKTEAITEGFKTVEVNGIPDAPRTPLADPIIASLVPEIPTPDLATAMWIWTPELPYSNPPQAPRGFRKVMNISNGNVVNSLIIDISCDNFQTVYVNGTCLGYGLDFRSAKRWSITFPPTNKVIIAVNAANDPISKGVAGLVVAAVAWDSIKFQGGIFKAQTDSSWRCTTTTPPKGFEQTNFNDRTWSGVRVMGPFGIPPWTVIKPTKTEAITEGFKTFEVNGIPDAPKAPLATLGPGIYGSTEV